VKNQQTVRIVDLVYGRVPAAEGRARELRARLYRPPPTQALLGAAIDVHGGAWYRGEHLDGAVYASLLAARGLLVLSIEFRHGGSDDRHPAACRDISAGIRFLRANADALGLDSTNIGVIGSSSGGHLALLCALLAGAADFDGTEINVASNRVEPSFNVAVDVPTQVDFAVGLWPVSDPAYRYAYAKANGRDELVAGHEAYFRDEEQMRLTSLQGLLNRNQHRQLPPLCIVQPGADANVPVEMTHALTQSIERRGGFCVYGYYPGMPHGFAMRNGDRTDACVDQIIGFVSSVTSLQR